MKMMGDKSSLSEKPSRSLGVETSSINKRVTVGVYHPQKAKRHEDSEQKEKRQEDSNSWRGWYWILIFWAIWVIIAVISHFL
jgi:cytoskeletal protein RodZ